MLEWSSRTWSIGPAVSWNIFHGGAIRQNIKVQNERQEQALINYETTVLNALEEVENILVAYGEEQQRMENLSRGADAAQNAVLLSEDQFQAGLVDFSNVLDAQRAQLNFQDELVRSKGAVISNLVRLYKALGGGWQISRGRSYLSKELAQKMKTRTDWGKLLDREMTKLPKGFGND